MLHEAELKWSNLKKCLLRIFDSYKNRKVNIFSNQAPLYFEVIRIRVDHYKNRSRSYFFFEFTVATRIRNRHNNSNSFSQRKFSRSFLRLRIGHNGNSCNSNEPTVILLFCDRKKLSIVPCKSFVSHVRKFGPF